MLRGKIGFILLTTNASVYSSKSLGSFHLHWIVWTSMTITSVFTVLHATLIWMARAVFQDHLINWDENNKMFLRANPEVIVHEGDNLVFACTRSRTSNQQLYWTMERKEYEECIVGRSPRSVRLLDCRDHQRSPEFILKIAPFSEIPLTPTFSNDALVYFMGQQELCSQNNLKLVVRTENSADALPVNHQNRPTLKTNKSVKLIQRNTLKDTMSADTEQPSQDSWEKYRFLIIPAALGLLTLCGIQAVICALWKPGIGLFSRHRHKPLVCGGFAAGQPAPSTLGNISSASHLSHSVEYIELVGLGRAIQRDQTCDDVKIPDDSVKRAEISLPENCHPLAVIEVKSEEFRAANTDQSCQWPGNMKVNNMVHFLPTDIVQKVDEEETWKPRAETENICVFSCRGVRGQSTSVPPPCQRKRNYLHRKSRKAPSECVINIAV